MPSAGAFFIPTPDRASIAGALTTAAAITSEIILVEAEIITEGM
jgi:hypothetical protein